MYSILLFLHSVTRWFVLTSLIYSIYRALRGINSKRTFSSIDNSVRHWTATIAHLELILGILLYTQSPIVASFLGNFNEGSGEPLFFGLMHLSMMLTAIVILTIGSAKAKRKKQSKDKFKTILIYYSVALVLILIAIPWPFSPLAHRPYIRSI